MSDDFEQMMKDLRNDYIQSLPQKITNIQLHLTEKKWSELRDDFHKLKGTGRTYGVPEITTLCEAVEKICIKKPDLIVEVVPKAAELLAIIHSKRSANNEFPIETDPSFIQIHKVASALS